MDSAKSGFQENVSSNSETKYSEMLIEILASKQDPDTKLTQENFLKLINSANSKMRAGDMVEKDILARKLYLKLEIDNKNKLSIRYREPFNLLVKNHLNGSGARNGT